MSEPCDWCGKGAAQPGGLLCGPCRATRHIWALYEFTLPAEWQQHLRRLASLAARGLPLFDGTPSPVRPAGDLPKRRAPKVARPPLDAVRAAVKGTSGLADAVRAIRRRFGVGHGLAYQLAHLARPA